jgi:hypothetical protein
MLATEYWSWCGFPPKVHKKVDDKPRKWDADSREPILVGFNVLNEVKEDFVEACNHTINESARLRTVDCSDATVREFFRLATHR